MGPQQLFHISNYQARPPILNEIEEKTTSCKSSIARHKNISFTGTSLARITTLISCVDKFERPTSAVVYDSSP